MILRIAVDIHDVIADYMSAMIEAYGEPATLYGLLKENFEFVDFDEHFGDHTHQLFLDKLSPLDAAVEGLWLLMSRYALVYVTAAPESARDVTERWLDGIQAPPAKIIFCGDMEQKARYITQADFIDIVLDDHPYIIDAATLSGKEVWIFDRPWNRNMNHGKRFLGWRHIISYVKRLYSDD